ncbi:MAG: DUF4038 domain-containing protein [Lentisphaeria bacterium]
MNYSQMANIVIFFLFVIMLCGFCCLPLNAIEVNQCWEQPLISTQEYHNPYKDVVVSVTYKGPNDKTMNTYGFWDGGNTFKIRCAFPTAGTWTWTTSCSDRSNSGLHHKKGSVKVTAYVGSNPIYKHGFLKVSRDHHYLAYKDDTPFLWMGDTAWIAPLKASATDWQTYVNDRVKKHFSVIQISPASAWSGRTTDTTGNTPFIGAGITQWNPAYWQGFEEKVEYANRKGLTILLVGIMCPVDHSSTSADAQLFARNIVARLYGNQVIFAPSFDRPYSTLGDEVGNAINAATSIHLITQHPNTPYHPSKNTTAEAYYDKSYLDFSANQSGHNGVDLSWCHWKAIFWNLSLYNRSPDKPVINAEAIYDGYARGGKTATAYDARAMGYLSWLSGSMGYTYGRQGLFNWETDGWKSASQQPSSTQMKYLYDFFNAIEWWRLLPAHDKIMNQSSDNLTMMAFAETAKGDFGVAYLPDNRSIKIDMSSFSSPVEGEWYNPTTGSYSAIRGRMENSGMHSFRTLAQGDWVLLLKVAQQESKK